MGISRVIKKTAGRNQPYTDTQHDGEVWRILVCMTTGNDSEQFNNQRRFATTRWNIVCAVGDVDRETASKALQELCQIYWYPLYTYVRQQGFEANSAADLTQAFFAHL